MEFHVSREARDAYQFDQSLFSFNGNVVFADFHAARVFAQQMNERRDLERHPEQVVKASEINAMGLIDEVLHLMVETYRRQVNPNVLQEALAYLNQAVGEQEVDAALREFGRAFPPLAVYRGEVGLDEYLAGETEGRSNRETTLEELLMLWLANANPAFSPYRELFDDADLEAHSPYPAVVAALKTFFGDQPGLEPGGETLIDLLMAPALASPHSLSGQLDYIRTRWNQYIGTALYRLLSSLDFIAEEHKAVFAGPGPIAAPVFGEQEEEPEQYSPDLDWMPRVVLLAKNAYVWLDQLSKQYQRPITRLDQVPDQELDTLAQRGITGLWLIGLWERSEASRRIKQMMGNPEAVASAYSLYDYVIAADLGGTEAMSDLRWRAWQRGIRMASDMVPNHMAIDSRWVIEHPDWFLSLPYSPFPTYTFDGPNLSNDERVGIYLEDHYYTHSDAAVVFKRVDQWTGDTRYIYHGNDGTSMPWNDTAQLNYLKAEVREAVIQTILHVARQFPIIRFDAAMTLAKRHIHRLWFPEPGSGGDIASRAEHGMTKAEFDAAMPEEFWREVVDRVAAEAPDTLLLAEAFWLMEGYFVRTLGMHRVYNSAFMHMLRDEDNDKYRQLIKNTLEFDPEILKRYVNFMSNPDEETAVAQFDKGDKYFGVCTIMATVPGLPMFGHGQFEGFAEKYGMEYRRAYWDEQPDQWLIDRHLREISPLLHRRHLFAEVQHFLLYDFFTPEGGVDENVIAYSNRWGEERSLVIYHNRWGDTRGWLHTSAAALDKGSGQLVQRSLGQGLQLSGDANAYVIFRDLVSGLEYIRNSRELVENGMYVALGAYQRHVFLDFREVEDNAEGHYSQLAAFLSGRGVPSVEEAVKELVLQPLHQAYRQLVGAETLQFLMDVRVRDWPEDGASPWDAEQAQRLQQIEQDVAALLDEVRAFAGEGEAQRAESQSAGADEDILLRRLEALGLAEQEAVPPTSIAEPGQPEPDLEALAADITRTLTAALQLPVLLRRYPGGKAKTYRKAAAELLARLDADPRLWGALFGWVFSAQLGRAVSADPAEAKKLARGWMDDWLLGKQMMAGLQGLGLGEFEAAQAVTLVKALISGQDWYAASRKKRAAPDLRTEKRAYRLLAALLQDSAVQQVMGVNRYEDILWYNQEGFETLLTALFAMAAANITVDPEVKRRRVVKALKKRAKLLKKLRKADRLSTYEVGKLLAALR
ncbi:MAG TPA: alpha-amylase [Caldilineae bacterium]|nr:alpha-amylase [Caldilineae bacterium]